MVRVIASEAAVQTPGPSGSSVVMVKITEPAVISAAEGVYTVVGSVSKVKTPEPAVVHVMLEAAPPNAPLNT